MKRTRWSILALVLLALGVRLFGLDWDQGHFFHPDERRIADSVSQLSIRPLQLHPHFFAYGSFPIYVTRAALAVAGLVRPSIVGYDGAILFGRILSAVWGALGVWILFLLGRRIFDERIALRAAAFLALAVLPIQSSHFGTNDQALTTLTTLALLFLVQTSSGESRRAPLLAGLVIGLAVATKVSALPLLLPVLVALVVRHRRTSPPEAVKAGGILAVAALAGFVVGEPYAFLDASSFLRDVAEQGRMVWSPGLVPYTTQYVGTLPYLYPIGQILLWGLGPVVGLVALGGTLRATWDRRTWKDVGALLVMAFLIPFFLVTGAFGVKFLRYMLPLYPLFLLFGAQALEGIGGRRGRFLRGAVLVGAALSALAFLRIYTRDHTVLAASRWTYRTLPPGTRILTQDWDEGFPFPLPDLSPDQYKNTTFPFYDQDGPQKSEKLAHDLAQADVVVFQTKRLYGAVTRDPSRYPDTNRFFRLFFAGDLGFVPTRDFASRPGLFGLSAPDELADESFSVYDHPRVLVYRNARRFSEQELLRRLQSRRPHRDLDRTAILLGAPDRFASRELPDRGIRSSLVALLALAIVLQLLGWAGAVFVRRLLPGAPAVALGKIVGVLVFFWLAWLGASLGVLPFRQPSLLALLACLAATAALLARREARPAEPPRERWVAEGFFWGAYVLFAAFRAFAPEIFWGEKPMDFAFLNALERSVWMPPPEPWFAGAPLHYTYLGHFAVACLGKTIGIAPGVLFNLGIATTAALLAAALVFAGRIVGGFAGAGAATAALGLLAGNLTGVFELARRHRLDFDLFWATSRVVPNAINEFPLWSLLFADLHAHLLALPFAVGFIGVACFSTVARPEGAGTPRVPGLALAALLLGSVAVMNAWSLPTYLFVWLALSMAEAASQRGAVLRAAGGAVLRAAAVAAAAFALWYPFWTNFRGPGSQWGREVGPWARPHELGLAFGLFAALLLPAIAAAIGGSRRSRRIVVGAAFLAAIAVASVRFMPGAGPGRFGEAASVRVLALALAAFCAAGAFSHANRARRSTLLLAALAFTIVLGCELFYVWDRMNTVFKFYFDAQALLFVSCGPLLAALLTRWGGLRIGTRLVAAPALLLSSFTTAVVILSALRSHHVEGPKSTLDGTAYLAGHAPDDAAAIGWLNTHVSGLPTIVEAWGPSYQDFSRISMHTGLPTVVGWDYHVQQRAQDRGEIERRKSDVATLYGAKTAGEARDVVDFYQVSWLVCGATEERAYGAGTCGRIARYTDVFDPAFRSAGGTLLLHVLASSGSVAPAGRAVAPVITTLEPAPAPAPGQAPGAALREPRGLVRDAEGVVYVADFGNDRIALLDSALRYLEAWGRSGSGPGELKSPAEVALGPGGRVWVADTWNHRVLCFDQKGKQLEELKGDLFGPRGVAVSAKGDVFVCDTGNARIVRFAPDGTRLSTFGQKGSGRAELRDPMGIAVDETGDVWVCDNGNGRICVFSPDGALKRRIVVPGWKTAPMAEPHISLDTHGLAWITVPLKNEIRAIDRKSGRVIRVVRSGEEGQEPFRSPIGITVDAKTQLVLVSDVEGRLSWVRSVRAIRQ